MFEPAATTAQLLIDVQQGFEDPVWGRRNNPNAEANIARLISAWRGAEAPVIHIFHDSRTPGSPLHPDSQGNAVKPESLPLAGEPQFRKGANSTFIGTGLEDHLRASGIEAISWPDDQPLRFNHGAIGREPRLQGGGRFGCDSYIRSNDGRWP